YNPKDSAEEWSNVELIRGKSKGLYTVKFSNESRSVSYSARPVLEGKDYDKALKVFEKNRKEYRRKLNSRLTEEKKGRQKYIQDSIANLVVLEENKKIERLNVLTEIRNKVVHKKNADYLSTNLI